MSNKKDLVKQNLEELSTRIGLQIKQYNLLAKSEDRYERLIFVTGTESDSPAAENSDTPTSINDLVLDYNDSRGWSSSESCW